MRSDKNPDYILIGHVTRDILDDGTTAMGGTASYATLTAAALGFRVGLLTSASINSDLSILASVANTVVEAAPVTTTFKNIYRNGSRHQILYEIANRLRPEQLPDTWKQPVIAHIGPVFRECDFELLRTFHSETFVGVTLQGMLREKLPDGCVIPKFWNEGLDILNDASAVIVSEDDIQGDWQYANLLAQVTSCLVVTSGACGGFIYEDNQRKPFHAPKVVEQNPTGAGDVFSAAFFSAAAKGFNSDKASLFASCLAAQSVTRTGLESIPTVVEIHQCSLTTLEG